MTIALGAVLIIVGLVGAAILAIGVPVAFGVMAYDVAQDRKKSTTEPVKVKDSHLHIAVERGVARAFVIVGGVFWSIATFAGLYSFRESGAGEAALAAAIPLAAVLATLVLGWYYERVTAALLVLASLAVVAWGVIYQFEIGVWVIMTVALIGPMLTAAVLFWLARREQEAYERAFSASPDLAFAFAARSSLG